MRLDIYHHYDRPEPVPYRPQNITFIDKFLNERVLNPHMILRAERTGTRVVVVMPDGKQFMYEFDKEIQAEGVLRALGR